MTEGESGLPVGLSMSFDTLYFIFIHKESYHIFIAVFHPYPSPPPPTATGHLVTLKTNNAAVGTATTK
jgi:hypothetical protein